MVPEDAPHQWLMKNLARALTTNSQEARGQLSRQLGKKISFALGDDKTLDSLCKARNRWVDTFANDREGLLFWTKNRREGTVVFIPRLPQEKELFQRLMSQCKRRWKKAGYSRMGVPEFWENGSTPDPEAGPIFQDLKKKKQWSGLYSSQWWVFQETTSGRIVYAVFPAPQDSRLSQLQMIVRAIFGFSLFLPLVLAFRRNILGGISLGRIMLGLFLASGFVPLIAVALGSFDFTRVYEQVFESRVQETQNGVIVSLIQGLDEFLMRNGRILQKHLMKTGSVKDKAQFQRLLAKIRSLGIGNQVICFRCPVFPLGKTTSAKKTAAFSGAVGVEKLGYGTITNQP